MSAPVFCFLSVHHYRFEREKKMVKHSIIIKDIFEDIFETLGQFFLYYIPSVQANQEKAKYCIQNAVKS